MAFRCTRAVKGPMKGLINTQGVGAPSPYAPVRKDVSAHLAKWWKNYEFVDGEVTRHLSPMRQSIVMPLIKNGPGNAFRRVKLEAPYFLPFLLTFGGMLEYMMYKVHSSEYICRD